MSATPPTPSDPITKPAVPVPPAPAVSAESARRRWLALGIVLFVSFAHFIVSSAYYAIGGIPHADSHQHQVRIAGALIAEAGALAVLWYVLSGQGRGWKDIGWNLAWMDVPRALGLVFGSTIASYFVSIAVQTSFRAYSGHYLPTKSMQGLLGGVSVLSIAFVCLNPFFEEFIVRGYLMSEVVGLGGKGVLAIFLSTAIQMSYHLYQGPANGIVLITTFTMFSIYFWDSRRIAPVVLAHLFLDAYALFAAGS